MLSDAPPAPNSRASRGLESRLRESTRAEVRFDRSARALYATDASLYQISPVGVLLPRSVDDVAIAVRIAAEEGVAIVPRGGATSLSGQAVGAGLVIDTSKYLNRIGTVDRDRNVVRVQPGVVLGRLNAELRPLGLMFGPDVSTADRATIGGMIGNNSAGARSLRFGKTVDHVRAIDVALADGTATTFGPLSPEELDWTCRSPGIVGRVHRVVRDEVAEHERAIRDHFPRLLRRVSGYNLDEFVPELPIRAPDVPIIPWAFNLARLIVGSEGTLAVVTGAELALVPAPRHQGVVVLSFSTIPTALDRLADDARIRAGGRRDGRPDDPRPRREEPRIRPEPELRPRGTPPPCSPPSSMPRPPTNWRAAATPLPDASEGLPVSSASGRGSKGPPTTTSGRSARPGSRS